MKNENLQQLVKSLNDGKVKNVIQDCKKYLKTNPKSVALLNIYAVALSQFGKIEMAKRFFLNAKKIEPNNPITPLNLGNLYFTIEDFLEAAKEYRQAIKLNPKYVRAYNNLGTTQQNLGLFSEAETNFGKAINLEPGFGEAHFNLAVTFRLQDKTNEAKKTYEHLLRLNPKHIDARNNLGILLQDIGDIDGAVQILKQARSIDPASIKTVLNLCEVYEKSNRLDEVEKLLDEIRENKAEDLLLYDAVLKFRRHNVQGSLNIILKINEKKLSKSRLGMFYQLKAKCFDGVGNFDAAFENFQKMNTKSASTKKNDIEKKHQYRKMISGRISDISNYQSTGRFDVDDCKMEPVFLVGFPRSGTTLTDTILRSHSKISVIEEIPLVTDIARDILVEQTIAEIEALSNDTIRKARKSYMDSIRDLTSSVDGGIIVDKLPMNIVEVPLLHALFPHAKLIFVLRHPLDTILSNFMQNFKLNEAMSNFMNISEAAGFYCDVMNLFSRCQERYDLSVHQIRYEDLIGNMQEQVTLMLKFLGLNWEDSLKNFDETALGRKEIRTPSYSQVTQPLYTSSVYRWKNYKRYILPECEAVLHWVSKFGYENIEA